MTDEADVRAAREALARASEVGGSAARAARRTVRVYLYATGAAMSLAGVASGLVGHWLDPAATWSRAVLTSAIRARPTVGDPRPGPRSFDRAGCRRSQAPIRAGEPAVGDRGLDSVRRRARQLAHLLARTADEGR
jgi:hypothetical protein